MHRRGFLKMAAGALSASAAALTVQKGIGLPQAAGEGVQGRSATLVPMQQGTQIDWKATTHAAMNGATFTAAVPISPGDLTMQFVTGPDPAAMVHIVFHPDGTADVLPAFDALPANTWNHLMAVPRDEFPEFDPANGVVEITGYESHVAFPDSEIGALRAHYAVAVASRVD